MPYLLMVKRVSSTTCPRCQNRMAILLRGFLTCLVDGTAIMPIARLPDGLHPDTQGHRLYADYILNVMGVL